MIAEFKSIDGIYVTENGLAFNPECHTAVIEISNTNEFLQKTSTANIYRTTYQNKILTKEFNNDISTYIKSLKAKILSIDNNFDFVMRDEKLENALGKVRLVKIIIEYKKITTDADCRVCVC